MKLVFATNNRGKLEELRALVRGLPIEAHGLAELGISLDVEEDAQTFLGNAQKKAEAVLAVTGLPSLADDSGLEVDALGGAPGVHSARYGGLPSGAPGADAANNARLLRELAAAPPPRRARFRCVLALARLDAPTLFSEGSVEGEIVDSPRGDGGFGYDPLFFIPSLGRTMAELDLDEKNRLSHRGQALRRMVEELRRLPAPAAPKRPAAPR